MREITECVFEGLKTGGWRVSVQIVSVVPVMNVVILDAGVSAGGVSWRCLKDSPTSNILCTLLFR